jgi:YVTN family beta-propeller protein
MLAAALVLSTIGVLSGAPPVPAAPISPPSVTATIAAGAYPFGVAVDPARSVYVTNEYNGTVSVIDESADAHNGTVTAVIRVGEHPLGVAVDTSTHTVYVADYGSNSVSVIDESGGVHTDTVIATIHVGTEPEGVAVDPARFWASSTVNRLWFGRITRSSGTGFAR